MNRLANIENIIKRSHLRFFNRKTLLIYLMGLILGFGQKCEAKVKQSAMFKFRFNALHGRDRIAKGKIFYCLNEVSNRRRDNKVREMMVKLVKGRSFSDKEIKDKFFCDWSRKAEIAKTVENTDVIAKYLKIQKHKLDLKKRWMNMGQNLAAYNGMYGTRYILDQADKLRRIEPIVKCIYNRNTALNGDEFLNKLRNHNILQLLKRSFAPLMGEKDDYTVSLHAKHWNNQSQKLLRREQLVQKLGDDLQNNFNNRALDLLKKACLFKKTCKLAEIVQEHNVLRKLKGENDHVQNIEGFANTLVGAQTKILENSTNAFRDKLYKFYVYKILMNMGDNFLKQQDANFEGYAKHFFDNFKKQFAPYKYNSKNLVHTLDPIMKKHTSKINKNVSGILGFLTLEKAAKKNMARSVMNKINHTYKESSIKGKLYTLLRQGYLKRQLSIFPQANIFLIFTYISQLYTKNVVAKKIKKISKGFKQWRYKHQNRKMAEEKGAFIQNSMSNFSEQMKKELLTGENGLIKQFSKYQNIDSVNALVLKKNKTDAGKNYIKYMNDKSNRLKTMRTMQHNDDNDDDQYGRDTIRQGNSAKKNLDK